MKWQLFFASTSCLLSFALFGQISLEVKKDRLVLSQQVCEYGRGQLVVNSLNLAVNKGYIDYFSGEQWLQAITDDTFVDNSIIAAIKPKTVIEALRQNRLSDRSEVFLQGNETCLSSHLELTADQVTQVANQEQDWQFPKFNFVYAVGHASVERPDADYQAQQDAIANGIRQVLGLIEAKAPHLLNFLSKRQQQVFSELVTDKLLEQDLSVLLVSKQHLQNNVANGQVSSHLLLSLNSERLLQRFSDMVQQLANVEIYINGSPDTLAIQLKQLLLERGIRLTEYPKDAALTINAKGKMVAVDGGYQALIRLELESSQQESLWAWQNSPSLMTVSGNSDNRLNQLLLAHLSLPKNQQAIVNQLDHELFNQAIKKLKQD